MCCNSHSCRVNKNNRCELNQTHYLTPPCHTPSHYTVEMHCAAAPLPTSLRLLGRGSVVSRLIVLELLNTRLRRSNNKKCTMLADYIMYRAI